MVALDPVTGLTIAEFFGEVSGNVKVLAVDGDDLYVGGSFWQVNGVAHDKLARFLGNGLHDTGWDPQPDRTVVAMSLPPSGGRIYAGGPDEYAGVENPNEARLAAIDLVTDLPDPTFAPTLDNPARGIDSTDDRVAVSYGGNNRFVVHDETGASVATWTGNGDFQAAHIVGDRAFVGSHSHLLGAYDRKQIAAVYLSDGSISLTFDTEVTGGVGVKAILASGSHLYLGRRGQLHRRHMERLLLRTDWPRSWRRRARHTDRAGRFIAS